MSKIETDGFISIEADEGKNHMLGAYPDLFELLKEMNKFSMRFIATTAVDGSSQYKMVLHTLLVRLLEIFQGTYLMLERGMMVPVEHLTRGMLEIMFMVVALEKKPNLLQAYLDQHEKNHTQMLRAALEFKGKALAEAVKQNNIKQLLDQKLEKQKGNKLKTLQVKEWAKEAELEDFYSLYYVLYSTSTHSSLSSLDDHIDVEATGEVNVAFGPTDKHLYEVAKCGMSVLVNAMQSIGKVFQQDLSPDLDRFAAQVKLLDGVYSQRS